MRHKMLQFVFSLAVLMISSMGFCQDKDPSFPAQSSLSSCNPRVTGGYGVYTYGSFIYWEPIQENMDLGLVSNATNALDLVNGDVIPLDFHYKAGFKVGVGVQFDYDNWETSFGYTWLRGTMCASAHLNSNNTEGDLLPAWAIPNFLNPHFHNGSEKWTLKMDLFDWVLGRSNALGKSLCLYFCAGLRGALISQDIRINYTNVNPAYLLIWPSVSIHQKTSSWGIGPELAVNSKWDLGMGIYIQALGEFDILFTQYDIRKTERSDQTVANRYRMVHDNANFLRYHTELSLGLGWKTFFCNSRYHLDLLADYGFQVFFDQNMFMDTASTQMAGKNSYPNGNLYLHGLTLTASFAF
ncbi:MAG: hypothetical protein KDK76_00670 [Chlamydiia bacterium]|nr:hypothetical protein [Chlamydiia bacterium]